MATEMPEYFYRLTGDRQVYIYRNDTLVRTLKGKRAADFVRQVRDLTRDAAQEMMKTIADS